MTDIIAHLAAESVRWADAACADTPGSHDERRTEKDDAETDTEWLTRATRAMYTCADCPIRRQCRDYAEAQRPQDRSGIYGGVLYRHGHRHGDALARTLFFDLEAAS